MIKFKRMGKTGKIGKSNKNICMGLSIFINNLPIVFRKFIDNSNNFRISFIMSLELSIIWSNIDIYLKIYNVIPVPGGAGLIKPLSFVVFNHAFPVDFTILKDLAFTFLASAKTVA